MEKERLKSLKKSAWGYILYEDSCKKDWEEILIKEHIEFAYAYHDKDINPDGESKKPHYHVLIKWDGPTTFNNAMEVGKLIGCANDFIEPIGSIRGMVRYFTHKDNPEKYQYSDSIVQYRNGFDIDKYIELTLTQKKEYKKAIQIYIKERDITEYADLMDYLIEEDLDYMYDVASTNTYYLNAYICSRRNKKKLIEKEMQEYIANYKE